DRLALEQRTISLCWERRRPAGGCLTESFVPGHRSIRAWNSLFTQPFLPMFAHQLLVVQMWIRTIHTIDFFALAGAERLVRVQTPDAFEQALPAQHFMDAGNTAGVVVGRVEKCGVGVCNFDRPLQEFARNELARHHDASAFCEKFD